MGNESMIRTSTLCFPAVGDVTLKPAEGLMIPDCGVHPEQIYDRPNSGRANCSFHAITTCETLESNCSFSIFFSPCQLHCMEPYLFSELCEL